jgi:hypothetical protein
MQAAITAGSPWPARVAYCAAVIFTLASAGTNFLYGLSKGTDAASSVVWAAVSVAVSVIFALSWPAVIKAIERKQWALAPMAFAALILTGAYSVTAALGSASGGRVNAATQEQTVTDQRTRTQSAYDAANAELASLKPSRPVAELEALVAGARPVCRVIVQQGRRDTQCAKPSALTAELGRAHRHAELEAKAESARAQLELTKPAKQSNSDAVALAGYLDAIGVAATAETVNRWLAILAVLAIEMGGGLSLAVGMAMSECAARSGQSEGGHVRAAVNHAERPTERLNERPERALKNVSSIDLSDRSPALSARPKRSAHERVLAALRAKDGVLFGSQGALGASFGWSKTRMNEVLHELHAAGRVRLSTTRQGTAVRLVAEVASPSYQRSHPT